MLSRDISLPSFSDLRSGEEATTPPERWPAGSPPAVPPPTIPEVEEEGGLPADAFCRICLDATTARSMLIAPCKCVPASAPPPPHAVDSVASSACGAGGCGGCGSHTHHVLDMFMACAARSPPLHTHVRLLSAGTEGTRRARGLALFLGAGCRAWTDGSATLRNRGLGGRRSCKGSLMYVHQHCLRRWQVRRPAARPSAQSNNRRCWSVDGARAWRVTQCISRLMGDSPVAVSVLVEYRLQAGASVTHTGREVCVTKVLTSPHD